MNWRSFLPSRRVLALLIAVIAVTGYFGWRMSQNRVVRAPAEIEDYLFWQAKDLSEFQLLRAGNGSLGLKDLRGRWTFVFFGYTHCPDICPVSLAVLGQAFRLIDQTPERLGQTQGIFISVDPGRDRPEALAEYAAYFHPRLIGATGSVAELEAFSRQIGVFHALEKPESGKAADDYLVTHSATIFLIDPEARLVGKFSPPQNAEEIVKAFSKIRAIHSEGAKSRWTLF